MITVASQATDHRAQHEDKAKFGDKSFATKLKVTWEQVAARKDEVLRLLKAEAPEVVKETVHSSTLSKFMSDKDAEFGDAGPAWWKTLREGVERHESMVLSITKANKTNRKK